MPDDVGAVAELAVDQAALDAIRVVRRQGRIRLYQRRNGGPGLLRLVQAAGRLGDGVHADRNSHSSAPACVQDREKDTPSTERPTAAGL